MLGFDNDKKLVKRPDDDPKFDKNNPLDKKILGLVILGISLTLILIIGFILLWWFFVRA